MARIGARIGSSPVPIKLSNNWHSNALIKARVSPIDRGDQTESGQFLSRVTAEYPPELRIAWAQLILLLVSQQNLSLSLDDALQFIPGKSPESPPFCGQDGAGFVSQGDWSAPHSFYDAFHVLRKRFFQLIVDGRLDKQVLAAFEQHRDQAPFTEDQIQPFRRLLAEFLEAQGLSPDWSVPEGQQIRLHILQQLCACMDDPDKAVFPYLIEGVPMVQTVQILLFCLGIVSQCNPHLKITSHRY